MDFGVSLSSDGNSGGMGFWWNDLNVNPVAYSKNYFMAEVRDQSDTPLWMVVGIYWWPEHSNKHLTWQLMRNMKSQCSLPMVFFRDFNEICSPIEKEGGALRLYIRKPKCFYAQSVDD